MSLPEEIRGLTREDVARITKKLHDERLIHSCLTCANFNEKGEQQGVSAQDTFHPETCMLYQIRPPARVIAYGCDSWEDDLPF